MNEMVKRVKMASGSKVPAALYEGAEVYDCMDPDTVGTLVKLGPQVSEVKWSDRAAWRNEYVSNVFLRVKED